MFVQRQIRNHNVETPQWGVSTGIIFMLLIWFFNSPAYSIDKKYEAVVQGTVIKKEVKKIGRVYITEYKLKTKKSLFKKPDVKEEKYLTIKVLGAELPEKGIIIKASTSPDYVPYKKEAVFLLEKTKSKNKNVYTIAKDGVIIGTLTGLQGL